MASASASLKAKNAGGLVVYLTAGDPNLDATGELLVALDRAGVDVIELGVPFSDPLADGPVIQRASERALRAGTTLRKILDRFEGWRENGQSADYLVQLFQSGAAIRSWKTLPSARPGWCRWRLMWI